MDKKRLAVEAAIEGLIAGQDTKQNAKVIIDAFPALEAKAGIKPNPRTFLLKSGGAGVYVVRVGEYCVWKSDSVFPLFRSAIGFIKGQGWKSENGGVVREYFLEYNRRTLTPVAFGHYSEPKRMRPLTGGGPHPNVLRFYEVRPILVFGRTYRGSHMLMSVCE